MWHFDSTCISLICFGVFCFCFFMSMCFSLALLHVFTAEVVTMNGVESVTETAIRELKNRKFKSKTPSRTSTLIITGVKKVRQRGQGLKRLNHKGQRVNCRWGLWNKVRDWAMKLRGIKGFFLESPGDKMHGKKSKIVRFF